MAITDLTGYTWVGNSQLSLNSKNYFNINFVVVAWAEYGGDATRFNITSDRTIQYETTNFGVIIVYENGTWGSDDTRTIKFTGGYDATFDQAIRWFENNGTLTKGGGGGTMLDVTYNSTKIIDSLEVTPPVTVTYNGSTIATLNAGDTKTLQCNGKVMASNVVIGEKTLQCNGKLMASDVVVEVGGVTPTGETWVINEDIRVTSSYSFSVAFSSNNVSYNLMEIHYSGKLRTIHYDSLQVWFTMTGYPPEWTNPAYRTVTFETPPTGELLTWLQANAVKQ